MFFFTSPVPSPCTSFPSLIHPPLEEMVVSYCSCVDAK